MNRRQFVELQARWYNKLKREGFKDIESFAPNGQPYDLMTTWPNKPPELAQHHAEYYRAASHFLHEYRFKTKLDRAIWALYCEGYSCGEISVKTKRRLKRAAIWLRIQKLDKKLKEWVRGNGEIRSEIHRESIGGRTRRRPSRNRRKISKGPIGKRKNSSLNSPARDRQIAKAFTEQLLRHSGSKTSEGLYSFAFAIAQRENLSRVNESRGY